MVGCNIYRKPSIISSRGTFGLSKLVLMPEIPEHMNTRSAVDL